MPQISDTAHFTPAAGRRVTRSRAAARIMGQTALIALLLPAAAFAQAVAEDDVTLDPVVLDGRGNTTGPVGSQANPTTSTGSKMAAKITEIPQSVSVIGSETLEAMHANKVDGALAYSAGVQTQPYGYDSDTNWFFVRGFAATATGAFIDGLPSYSYGFGGFYVDPALLERIEVLRGPASALYGAANPGGIVNMVTKRPTGTPGGTDTIGVDETGRAWLETDREGVTASGLNWRFVAKAERTDDTGVFEPGKHLLIAPSVSFSLGDATDVTLSASYTKIDEDHVGGGWLPYVGTVVDAPFGRIPRDFNTGEPGLDWYKRDQVLLSSEVTHQFGGGWRLVNNTRFGWSKVDESAPYAYGYLQPDGFAGQFPTDADGTLVRTQFQQQSETKTVLNDLRFENTLRTGALEHRLMVGFDAKWFELDEVQASGAATTLSVVNPVYGQPQPAMWAPYADEVINQTQFGLYAQDQIRWGDGWIATLNLRHDIARSKSGAQRGTGAAGSTRKDGETTWRIGLAKEFGDGFMAYASASSYFNPEIVTTADGAVIAPETGRQGEIGIKWAPTDATLVTLSAFDMTRENVTQSVWNSTTFRYDYSQIGKVRSRGLELEAKHTYDNGLTLAATATAMDVKVKADVFEDRVGKTPYSTIEDMATVKADYKIASVPGLTVSGGLRYLGSSWADFANEFKVPSTILVDVGTSYEFADGWKASLAVTNLTDETYVTTCKTTVTCYYGEERRASFSVSRKF